MTGNGLGLRPGPVEVAAEHKTDTCDDEDEEEENMTNKRKMDNDV